MPSIFRRDSSTGDYFAYHDPNADLIYGITTWIDGRIFVSGSWDISPAGSPAASVHDSSINSIAVTIDGVVYAAGEVATVWATGLAEGVTYELRLHATFDDGQIDDRTVTLICAQR